MCAAFAAQLALADEVEDKIKEIGKKYAQTEEQLARSVHYLRQEEKNGETVIQQVWLTEARDLLKAATERRSAAGRELTEIFIAQGEQPFFVLTRRETPAAEGGTHVEESRRYLEYSGTFRLLTKDATFPAGASLDTVKIKNVPVEVKRAPDESDSYTFFQEATRIAQSATASGPPQHDPGAGSPGDSARYRLIQRTTSDDGRLALGFAPTKTPVNWAALADTVDEDTGYQSYRNEDGPSRNYVIDLTTHRILCATGCAYEGTRSRYNHLGVSASWSPNDRFFAQTCDSKWSTDDAVAGWIDREHGKAAATDLLKAATEHAYRFLAAHKDRAYRQFGKHFSVTVSCQELLEDGTMTLVVAGEIPKSDEQYSSFAVSERFRIKRDGAKAAVEFLDTKAGETP